MSILSIETRDFVLEFLSLDKDQRVDFKKKIEEIYEGLDYVHTLSMCIKSGPNSMIFSKLEDVFSTNVNNSVQQAFNTVSEQLDALSHAEHSVVSCTYLESRASDNSNDEIITLECPCFIALESGMVYRSDDYPSNEGSDKHYIQLDIGDNRVIQSVVGGLVVDIEAIKQEIKNEADRLVGESLVSCSM